MGAVIDSGRAVSETARAHGVSWWLVQAALTAAAVLLPEVDALPVTRIGVDEHRDRAVRYFRTPAGGWRRFEPWMSTIVNLDTGQALGVVDGRDSAAIDAWLAPAWRDRVEVVAIDPSAAFREALRQQLPGAAAGRGKCTVTAVLPVPGVNPCRIPPARGIADRCRPGWRRVVESRDLVPGRIRFGWLALVFTVSGVPVSLRRCGTGTGCAVWE